MELNHLLSFIDNVAICCVSEPQLDAVRDDKSMFQIANYSCLRIDRETREGVGMMTYINQNFSFELIYTEVKF